MRRIAPAVLLLTLAWSPSALPQDDDDAGNDSIEELFAEDEAAGQGSGQEPSSENEAGSEDSEIRKLFSPDGPSWDEKDDGPRDDDDEAARPLDSITLAEDAAPRVKERSDRRVTDEIVVTAQKREQAIQDVPISMSVIDDRFIAKQGITDVKEALQFVPNIKLETGTTLGGPRCRGFSLNIRNRAFEPPCGVALDGVPYTVSEYFNLALFDVQRIEVLRGPQGTTFGKNTTAGVINLITKDPTDQYIGHANLQRGDVDRSRIEAAYGGPIIEGVLNFRVAGLKEERGGYLTNTTALVNDDAVRHPLSGDREGLRVKLAFPDLLGSELLLSYETVELLTAGLGTEAFDVSEDLQAYFSPFDPDADYEKGNFITSMDNPELLRIALSTLQADWQTEIADWSLAAVAAHSVLDRELTADLDYFPAPVIEGFQNDRNPTLSAEIRAFSPRLSGLYGLDRLFGRELGSSELLAGIFFQRRKIIDSVLHLQVDDPLILGLLALDGAGNTGLLQGLPQNPLPVGAVAPAKETLDTTFSQDADTVAAFAEFQWYFAPRWTLQYGMRLSYETKEAVWDQNLSQPHPVLTVAGFAEFEDEKSRNEFQFLPKLSLNYKLSEDISLFARWTRGFKGGGFNAFSLSGESDELTSLSFGPEETTEWAFDAKMALWEDAAKLNVSLFRMDVLDFQYLVQVDDELSGFPTGNTVVNVGHARSQGIEADFIYLPWNWLTVMATIGFNDTEFVDFPFNSCPQGMENTDGDDDPRCDVSGRSFPFTPKWNNTLGLEVNAPLGELFGGGSGFFGGLEFTIGGTAEHISEQFLNVDLGPDSHQDGFFRFKASVGLGNPHQDWSLRLIGENLTNEITSLREDSLLGVKGSFPEPPRVIYGQFQLGF